MRTEKWMAVPAYEGRYEIGESGAVRSLRAAGKGYDKQRAEPLLRKPVLSPRGYLQLPLSTAGVVTTWSVHTLVLLAFHGPRPEGHEGCHNDGNPLNNHWSNLRWGTSLENKADMRRHGTTQQGAKHYAALFSEDDIRCIRAEPEFRGVCAMLGRKYGRPTEQIWAIRKRRAWKHVDA